MFSEVMRDCGRPANLYLHQSLDSPSLAAKSTLIPQKDHLAQSLCSCVVASLAVADMVPLEAIHYRTLVKSIWLLRFPSFATLL